MVNEEEIEGELNTMPKGRFPFRRTFEFLSGGKLILKSDIKSVVLNYTHKPESRGLRYCTLQRTVWEITIDPLHMMRMQPVWRTKEKKLSLLGIEIYSHI